MKTGSRSVITIATGKKLYVDLAANLARSFFWWHPGTDIRFQLATDRAEWIPEDIKNKIQIIYVKPGQFGEGFSPKLHLDHLVSEGETLFIDSDCLIFGDINPIFQKFKGHAVSVVGGYIAAGEWFGDIASICLKYQVPHIPKFNGGIYYLEKGDKATLVYETARELEEKYDEIGFVRLRNRPNDEVLMALAMQIHGQKPIADEGTIMSDPQACPGGYAINILSGKRWLLNPPAPHPLHQSWYPFKKVSPLIFHFLGHCVQHYPYKREVLRLQKAGGNKLNLLAEIYILLSIEYFERGKIMLKNIFRPFYHSLFGPRKIKTSERI